jgi:hypothetical protein
MLDRKDLLSNDTFNSFAEVKFRIKENWICSPDKIVILRFNI